MENSKTGLLVWSPLAGGLLSGKFSRENQKPANSRRSDFDFPIVNKERAWNIVDVMKKIAAELNCTVAQVALAWLLAKPVVTSVIIGARNLQQLDDNCGSIDLNLNQYHMDVLNEVSALPPEYPGWMIPVQALDRLDPKVDRFAALKEHSLAAASK
jgi:aryl-alcohol dehydrogenase-like predicted oxidoreductase